MVQQSFRRIGMKNGREVRLSDREYDVLCSLPLDVTEVRTQTRNSLIDKELVVILDGKLQTTEFGHSLTNRPNLSDSAIGVLSKLPLPFREWKKQSATIRHVLIKKGLVEDDGFGCVVLTEKAQNDCLLRKFLNKEAA